MFSVESPIDQMQCYGYEAHPLVDLTIAYLEATKLTAQLDAAEAIHRYGRPTARGIAAYAYIDTLGKHPDIEQYRRQEIFEEASQCATESFNSARLDDETASAKVKVRALQGDLPLIRAMYVEERYPTGEEVQQSILVNNEALALAMQALAIHPKLIDGERSHTHDSLVGTMSEIVIKNLFNRFGAKLDGEYFATTSLYSQDNSRVVNPYSVPWDVSVFSSVTSNPYLPAYKTQVKTSRFEQDTKKQDVHIVSPVDLGVESATASSKKIAYHLLAAYTHQNQHSHKRLDDWTEPLLDRIEE